MSNYKQIPENTFGETPAAMYLCRRLNEDKNSVALRSAGRRISGTASQVRQLVSAYELGVIEAKTMANSLRLMREEITSETKPELYKFEDQLRRNIQIGYIKQGLRLATLARKVERVMSSPDNKARKVYSKDNPELSASSIDVVEYYFKDNQSGKDFRAGELISVKNVEDMPTITVINRPILEDADDITPALLHMRSNRRCLRLGKPHATVN